MGTKLGTSTFEIDTNANLRVDGTGISKDWLNAAPFSETVKADKATGAGDDSFGNGSKEDTAVPSVTDGSIPPNKSDLKNFGVWQEKPAAGGSYLHLFWSRVQDPSGTTNMDFEFNKSTTLSSNGVTSVRSAGDLLITYDLSNGGTNPTLSKRTWTGSAWGSAQALTGNAIGSINTTTIPATESGGLGSLSPRTFGEATIDTNAIFTGAGCASFGSAYLKSRSSDTFSSALKDFIAPRPVTVTNCGVVPIHKQDDLGADLGGATFTLYTNVAPLAGPRGVGDTVTTLTCTTTSDGDCTISNVPFGSYWVVETVTPANHGTAADQAVTVAPSGNTPSGELIFVDPRLQGSIIVAKKVGTTLLAGAGFTLDPGGVMTETATDGLFCTDGLDFGDYTVTETTVPAGYQGADPQDITVSSASTCAARLAAQTVTPDLTFLNTPAPGRINVSKTDDATPANPLAGAQFTLFADIGNVGTYEPTVDTDIADGPLTTSAAGTVSFTDVDLGNYCVVETVTPTGYATAAPQCRTIALGDTAGTGTTLNLTFVDPRLHKVIVLVCHEGTNTLDSSAVTIDGTSTTSLGSAPAGFTEAQLCGLGGATKGGLSDGAKSATITID